MPTCYRHSGRESYIKCQRCERPICPDCMRDAAVGFHCPNCVAEGAKSTRSGRTAYGGLRSGNPGHTSMVLIGLNALVWLFITATGGAGSRWVNRLALLPTGRCESLGQPGAAYALPTESACLTRTNPVGDGSWIAGVSDGAVYQLLSSAFTHVEIWHIGFNMLALWVLGPQLEMAIGRVRFLALYLLSAFAGSAMVYWLAAQNSATLGASGAVFGLMGGLLIVALKVRGSVQQLLMWIGINFVITVVGRGYISWQGHLGGFLGGVAIAAVLVYAPRKNRTAWQLTGLGLIAVVLVAAILTRTLALR